MSFISQRPYVLAIAYADIFDFPLTLEEIYLWSIGPAKHRPRFIKSKNLSAHKVKGKEYYSFGSIKQIVSNRLKRETITKKKWKIAQIASRFLRYIPTIELLGVTGGVAMNNAGVSDDVDLFIVTSEKSLWITRFLATGLLQVVGLRRGRTDPLGTNKVCLNMFMRKDTLTLPLDEQDLFSAHEVLQMIPLWERDDSYQKFLQANAWVKEYLPHAWESKVRSASEGGGKILPAGNLFQKVSQLSQKMIIRIFQTTDSLCQYIQLAYMSRHRTKEVVTESMIRFHPRDARTWIYRKLAVRLRKLNIPLDKNWKVSIK